MTLELNKRQKLDIQVCFGPENQFFFQAKPIWIHRIRMSHIGKSERLWKSIGRNVTSGHKNWTATCL